MAYARLFARDLSIVTAAVILWRLASGLSAGQGVVSDFTGLVVGVALGVCVFPLHEWGHFLGAIASRSTIHPPSSLRAIFVFGFDARRNSRGQFLAMSLGGWAGTAAGLWVAYGLLPPDLLASRVARGMALLSLLLVVVTEVPLLARGLWTGRLPGAAVPSRSREQASAS